MEAGSAHLLLVLAEGTRRQRNKNPERRAARADWRSFGEYIFLEDSRYASQRKNTRRNGIYPPYAHLRPVMRGLDPRIHRKKRFFQGMDCRVKPGNDHGWVSANAVDVSKLRLGVCFCGGGSAAFRFAAKRATYCADGRKRQDQAERERARDPGRAREEGVVACELDHPPRQPPARERRWREGRRASGLLGLARHHHDRALFPRAA